MNERQYYGNLIARLMAEKIRPEEERQLDFWVSASDDNMKLYEKLINEYNSKWARKWFSDAGISTRGIKWTRVEGWYRPEEATLWQFYVFIIVFIAVLTGIYYILEL